MRSIRAASDVGGTFTDLVYYEVDGSGCCGTVRTAKVDTTPPTFERGVIHSLKKAGVRASDVGFFAHGSTVVINSITERKGATVGLITTAGFRDVLEIARGNRPDLFNFQFRKPPPFVPRNLRCEIPERTNYRGEVETSPQLDALPAILDHFRDNGVTAVAICFLHAYVNPSNESRVASRVRELWPEVSVVASHEVTREWREYERTSTTVLSAFVHPVSRRYIESLEYELGLDGLAQAPYLMLSNGGIATVATARENPVAMVESGPASGIYAAAHVGALIGEKNLIVLDIGGTTAKCALIEAGEIKITTQYSVQKNRRSPGYPIQTPVSEIVEIGNGGGSIAWVDAGGKLHVGPESAGAMPGPAAYGRGGQLPTTTDANLLLGRIDSKSFAGGELEPDWHAVHRAFAGLGEQLGCTPVEAARGVVRIANANMTNALRLVSTNKGFDPRDFALMAFGGGGPMHAVSLAEELHVPRVIVPVHSAVFSAWGMLLTDLRRDYVQTRPMALAPATVDAIAGQFRLMEESAAVNFTREGIPAAVGALCAEYLADMRYRGQEHTVKVPVPIKDGIADVASAADIFHLAHEKRFTYRLPNPVEIVNFHLVVRTPVTKPELSRRARTGRTLTDCMLPPRRVDFDTHGIHEAQIYDGAKLEPGMRLSGPAIVQEPAVTLVVPPGNSVELDDFGNYRVHIRPGGSARQ